jgi:hypothetical protein
MTQHRSWLLKLVLPFRYGRLCSGVLLFAVLYPVFRHGQNPAIEITVPALFFGAIIGYMIWVVSYITEKFRDALLELRPHLEMEDGEFEQQLARLGAGSTRSFVIPALLGLCAGLAHLVFMTGSWSDVIRAIVEWPRALIGFTGTTLVWIVMTTAISELIKYTLIFSQLGGRSVRIDLLHTRPLLVFSRVAVISTLAVIGAQALFPLMYLDLSMNAASMVPGLIGTVLPMVLMFAAPVLPLHQRMQTDKSQALAALDERVVRIRDAAPAGEVSREILEELNPLLLYRREISRAPVWPFDAGSFTRLFLYLVIVPMTWAGAALIERLMENLI